jgi:hypothetical protein
MAPWAPRAPSVSIQTRTRPEFIMIRDFPSLGFVDAPESVVCVKAANA